MKKRKGYFDFLKNETEEEPKKKPIREMGSVRFHVDESIFNINATLNIREPKKNDDSLDIVYYDNKGNVVTDE